MAGTEQNNKDQRDKQKCIGQREMKYVLEREDYVLLVGMLYDQSTLGQNLNIARSFVRARRKYIFDDRLVAPALLLYWPSSSCANRINEQSSSELDVDILYWVVLDPES